ncbi:hypothetical protein GKE82_23720 [Conexibacter sp. W3-3-2]|uniref:type IV secretory system conjugative DNA transfer family protein n=1 Tax=Conexibacter sp. W3-3-2 TaxID=2675227 RepID=UPI0012B7A0BE|nr:type IV secretory system conjugative DNA transfer family protein [Conexibacter sp. W3-3-2]MTD47215.1 hypothetical protein [Conexibacter sp. W3-3-2]
MADSADPNAALVVLDPKNEVSVRAMECIERVTGKRVWYLDLADPEFGLSPLLMTDSWDAIADNVVEMLRDINGQDALQASSARFLKLATYGVLAFAKVNGDRIPTMEELYYLLQPSMTNLRSAVADSLAHFPHLTEAHVFFGSLMADEVDHSRSFRDKLDAPSNKLAAAVLLPAVKKVLQHPVQISLEEIIRRRDILIVNGRLESVGENAALTVLTVIMRMLNAAMSMQQNLARGDRFAPIEGESWHERRARLAVARPRVCLFVDEAHMLFTENFARMLAVHREAGLEVTAAWQYMGQIQEDVIAEGMWQLLQTKYIFRLGGIEDAEKVAKFAMQTLSTQLRNDPQSRAQMRVGAETLLTLAQHHALKFAPTPRGRSAVAVVRTFRMDNAQIHGGYHRAMQRAHGCFPVAHAPQYMDPKFLPYSTDASAQTHEDLYEDLDRPLDDGTAATLVQSLSGEGKFVADVREIAKGVAIAPDFRPHNPYSVEDRALELQHPELVLAPDARATPSPSAPTADASSTSLGEDLTLSAPPVLTPPTPPASIDPAAGPTEPLQDPPLDYDIDLGPAPQIPSQQAEVLVPLPPAPEPGPAHVAAHEPRVPTDPSDAEDPVDSVAAAPLPAHDAELPAAFEVPAASSPFDDLDRPAATTTPPAPAPEPLAPEPLAPEPLAPEPVAPGSLAPEPVAAELEVTALTTPVEPETTTPFAPAYTEVDILDGPEPSSGDAPISPPEATTTPPPSPHTSSVPAVSAPAEDLQQIVIEGLEADSDADRPRLPEPDDLAPTSGELVRLSPRQLRRYMALQPDTYTTGASETLGDFVVADQPPTDPTAVQLGDRDVDVLFLLHRLRFLTMEQIQVVFWPGRKPDAPANRMRALFNAGYVQRYTFPVLADGPAKGFTLTRTGFRALKTALPTAITSREEYTPYEPNRGFWHTLGVAGWMTEAIEHFGWGGRMSRATSKAARAPKGQLPPGSVKVIETPSDPRGVLEPPRGPLATYETVRSSYGAASRSPLTGPLRAIAPDLTLGLRATPAGSDPIDLDVLVEFDRSTGARSRNGKHNREKFQNYDVFFSTWWKQLTDPQATRRPRPWKVCPRVLIVAESRRAMTTLMNIADQEMTIHVVNPSTGVRRYYGRAHVRFTTVEAIFNGELKSFSLPQVPPAMRDSPELEPIPSLWAPTALLREPRSPQDA